MGQEKEDPVLEDEGILLKRMDEDDTENIIRWRNTEFVRRNFIYQKPFTKKGHENWIREMIRTGKAVQFMIVRKDLGEPVGSVYLRDIDRTHNKAEYGIFIGEKDAIGRGYGTRAAKLMLRVLAENIPAIKSYEKAGFVREAYLKDEVFLDGQYKDVVYMAVIKFGS
mgnify:CR=1 FL=1